eukprot:403354346
MEQTQNPQLIEDQNQSTQNLSEDINILTSSNKDQEFKELINQNEFYEAQIQNQNQIDSDNITSKIQEEDSNIQQNIGSDQTAATLSTTETLQTSPNDQQQTILQDQMESLNINSDKFEEEAKEEGFNDDQLIEEQLIEQQLDIGSDQILQQDIDQRSSQIDDSNQLNADTSNLQQQDPDIPKTENFLLDEEVEFDLDKNDLLQQQLFRSISNQDSATPSQQQELNFQNQQNAQSFMRQYNQSVLSSRDNHNIERDRETMYQKKQQDEEEQKQINPALLSIEDFNIVEQIGKGSYGRVFVANREDKLYAVKELNKEFIISLGKTENVFRERDILKKLDHPAITKLYYTFQDENNLYFVMEHIPYGSLQDVMDLYLQKKEKMSLKLVQFYAAWLILAIEHLHSESIVHRDLKPQNILVDAQHYLKLIDFGDSKEINEEEYQEQARPSQGRLSAGSFSTLLKQSDKDKVREPSFVGTPLYVAPEMLECNQAGRYTDLWALGCIIYQMLCENKTPFHGKGYDEVFQNILERRLRFPSYIDKNARDLIDKLLDFEPYNRLGYRDYNQLKAHPFFSGINFDLLKTKTLQVPDFEKFHDEHNEVMATEEEFNPYLQEYEMINHSHIDDCLDLNMQYGPIDLNMKVMEGKVKLRRNLIFFKRRTMILLEDGRVILTKDKDVRTVFILDKSTEITLQKRDRFQIKTVKIHEVVESHDAEVWVNILKSIKSLNFKK